MFCECGLTTIFSDCYWHQLLNPLQNLTWNFHSFLSKNSVTKLYCTLLFCFFKGRKALNIYLYTIFLVSVAVHLSNPEAFEHGETSLLSCTLTQPIICQALEIYV